MKQRITAAELKAMTMKEMAAWVEFNACAINRTMVMSWGHEELFKGYHIRPEYIGYNAGRLIVKAFHFTSRTRKADAQSFAEWLHWAIFGEYPAEETEETTAHTETTESENMDDSMNWDYVESELWKRHEKMTKREENTMKYDNCKGCGNIHCEHYGKDREFVCPNGISCKTEKIKNTKTYIIKCVQFHVNEDFNMIGNPIIREFSGSSLGEAKTAWMMARANNDMTKYSPLNVCDIIIPEEK